MVRDLLPPAIDRLLWEYAPASVSWTEHAEVIVERVLTRGGLASWQWLRARCSTTTSPRRGRWRHFIDVYALLRAKPLPELLALYGRRFEAADPGHVLVALSYFDDAEQSPMPRMIWPVTWRAIRRHIETAVRDVVTPRRR